MESFAIRNYSCRYMPDKAKSVYAIVRPAKYLRQEAILSVPFYNKHSSDTTNALIAFECPSIASNSFIGSSDEKIEVSKRSLSDLVEFAAILKMPVVVIISASCEINLVPALQYRDVSPEILERFVPYSPETTSSQTSEASYEILYYDPRTDILKQFNNQENKSKNNGGRRKSLDFL